jgi:hypothetical protein
MFRAELARAYEQSPLFVRRFLSIGCGNCETEIALARHLVDSGRATRQRFDGIVYRHQGAGARGLDDVRHLVATPVGAGSLDFADWKTASLSWQVDDDRIVKTIERMDF